MIALPSRAEAQTCDLCDNGLVEGEVAHQFGMPLGEDFECGEPGQGECHTSYAVAGKCSDNHCFCGGNCQTFAAAIADAVDLESPALFQKALAGSSEWVRVDDASRSLAVLGCGATVVATLDLPVWVTDAVLAGLKSEIHVNDPTTLLPL